MLEHPHHINLANKVAESGITLLHRSERFPINLRKLQSVYHIIITDTDFTDQPLKHFCEELNQKIDSVVILNNPKTKEIQALQIQKNSVIIISLQFRTIAKNQQKLDWKYVNQAIRFLRKFKCPLIVFLFGNPYQINNLPPNHDVDALLLTYSDVEASQRAAFKVLTGSISIKGKLPVQLNKPFNNSFRLPVKRNKN